MPRRRITCWTPEASQVCLRVVVLSLLVPDIIVPPVALRILADGRADAPVLLPQHDFASRRLSNPQRYLLLHVVAEWQLA